MTARARIWLGRCGSLEMPSSVTAFAGVRRPANSYYCWKCPAFFCKTFEAIPGYHLHVVQSDCSHAVLLKPLVDLIEVITDDLLLSVRGLASMRLACVLQCRVIQLL